MAGSGTKKCALTDWGIRAQGDAIRRRVTIDRAKSKIDAGITVTKAWLTIRSAPGAAIVVQKAITVTDVPGTGEIENNGGTNQNPVLRFDLQRADTLPIPVASFESHSAYHFDVQALASDGSPVTVERGKVYCCHEEITVVVA